MTRTGRMNFVRMAMSFVLVLLLVFSPLMEIHAHAASFEDVAFIIWAALRSCGINLVGTVSSVVSFILSELSDYAESLQTTVTNIVYGLKYSVNSLGEFIINDTFVNFIDNFIDFIQGKYNLTDNGTKQLTPSNVTLDGLVSYPLPLHIERSTGLYSEWEVYLTGYDVYANFSNSFSGGSVSLSFWSEHHSYIQRIRGNNDGVTSTDTFELVETANNGIFWYKDNLGFGIDAYGLDDYEIYLWDDVHTAYTEPGDIIIPGPPVTAYTTTIVAPQYNADFVFGDGAVINIGSDWGDSIYDLFDHIRRLIGDLSNQITIYYRSMQQIEGQVPPASDVTNLPSGSIYQINGLLQDSNGEGGLRFDGIWHYVSTWVEDFTEAAPIVWFVATHCPDPIVNMIYAVTVITIVIGFIHKARSH